MVMFLCCILMFLIISHSALLYIYIWVYLCTEHHTLMTSRRRSLADLICIDDPGIAVINNILASSTTQHVVLPASEKKEEVLLHVQVSTRSTLGAMAYETGGIVIDYGWLRFLGSGNPSLSTSLIDWNTTKRGYYVIATDAIGGVFAVNGGTFDGPAGDVWFLPPDALQWESLEAGYTDFFAWCLTPQLAEFYSTFRWDGWDKEVNNMPYDATYNFVPFLWTKEGSITDSDRRPVPAIEAFNMKLDIIEQLQAP